MATHDNMEESWGVAATHAEHRINDAIRYTMAGQTRTGNIIWISAPTPGDQYEQSQSMHYVVQPDDTASSPDLVPPASIIIDKGQKPQAAINNTSAAETLPARIVGIPEGSGQDLVTMLSSLPIPIVIKAQTDNNGRPFYIWHIGTATALQPYGMYVGISRDFTDALKLAIERIIRYSNQQA